MSHIPLVDLRAEHAEIATEVQAGLSRLFDSADFILGREVAAFEAEFAQFVRVPHCIGVASGTDALELILRAVGVGPGDEVVVPANTFIATALAVVRAGATPVLVDSDPEFHLIDVGQVAARLGPRTRAIIPVHLFGQMAPMEALHEIAGSSIVLIEDAAQGHGAKHYGKDTGHFGVAAATSFYPSKNLGAYGDAGAVYTSSDALARTVRALRNYGSDRKYFHPEIGFNSRLDSVQAVVLRAKLKRLAVWNESRRRLASRYDELLSGIPGLKTPRTLPGNEHVWHLYTIRVPGRDRVLEELRAAGVGAAVHYPIPIHLQEAFRNLGYGEGDFPSAEAAARELISLPLFPSMTSAQQDHIAETLRKAVG